MQQFGKTYGKKLVFGLMGLGGAGGAYYAVNYNTWNPTRRQIFDREEHCPFSTYTEPKEDTYLHKVAHALNVNEKGELASWINTYSCIECNREDIVESGENEKGADKELTHPPANVIDSDESKSTTSEPKYDYNKLVEEGGTNKEDEPVSIADLE